MSVGYRVFVLMCAVSAWIILLVEMMYFFDSPLPMLGIVCIVPFIVWAVGWTDDGALEI